MYEFKFPTNPNAYRAIDTTNTRRTTTKPPVAKSTKRPAATIAKSPATIPKRKNRSGRVKQACREARQVAEIQAAVFSVQHEPIKEQPLLVVRHILLKARADMDMEGKVMTLKLGQKLREKAMAALALLKEGWA